MQLSWHTRKCRAAFACRLIADRDHEIERLRRQLMPRLAARLPGIEAMSSQRRNRSRMHRTRWETSCAPRPKPATAQIVQQRFDHHGAARISGADNQHLHHVGSHQPQQAAVCGVTSQQSGVPFVSGVQQALSICSAGPENSCASSMVR